MFGNKMKAALLSILLAANLLAELPFPDSLKISGTVSPIDFNSTKLPVALQSVLLEYDSFQVIPDKLPDVLSVLLYDLNTDGRPEYFVWERTGYSGGPMIHIFSSEDTGFKSLGSMQGGFYFANRKNGYFQIVSTGRAGGGVYTRCLYSFAEGKYRLDRVADYKIPSDDREEYLRDRDPALYNRK